MKQTIEQALKQGVAAHQEGKLRDAERFYRIVLQSHPAHPDANHNLGVLAVSVNKLDMALPLFKTALEANPKIEQFWLSYIDALIREKRYDNANKVLEQGKKYGVAGEKLKAQEVQLASLNKEKNADKLSPSQVELNILLEQYQSGRFSDAEKLAKSIIQAFPQNQFSWKVLGAILGQTGRNSEAVDANKTAIALSPQDAKAHSNLGITLQQLGRLEEAEASYAQAILLKPDYAEAHSNLANTLKELSRLEEAETSYTKAISFKPDYPEAHMNLGNMLKELGRLDEAEACYKKVISLKPDYAEAHINLGNTLKELGRLKEAEDNYSQAISLKPNYAEAYSNLGITLQELGRLEEAEANFTQAISLKPNYAEAYSNLGITLQGLGRLKDAITSYTKAISLKSDFVEAILNLSVAHSYMNNLEAEIVSLQNVLLLDSNNHGLKAGVNLAICNFLKGDFSESKKQILAVKKIQENKLPKFKNEKVYQRYLLNILNWHKDKCLNINKRKDDNNLYVLGESHSLTSHHLRIQYSGANFFCQARLIKGCKQWHLGNTFRNQFKHQFENIFYSLPKQSYILLAIGEIDCRLDTGIIKHKKKFPEKKINKIILDTIKNYINYVISKNSCCKHKIIIQGVPCPNINMENYAKKDIEQLVEVINIFNDELKIQSKEKGFGFLDTHQLSNKGKGLSNNLWHIDTYHISPDGMFEAWRRYSAKQ